MLEALCRQSSTTLDIVHAEDGPPITQRTSGLCCSCLAASCFWRLREMLVGCNPLKSMVCFKSEATADLTCCDFRIRHCRFTLKRQRYDAGRQIILGNQEPISATLLDDAQQQSMPRTGRTNAYC